MVETHRTHDRAHRTYVMRSRLSLNHNIVAAAAFLEALPYKKIIISKLLATRKVVFQKNLDLTN